LKTIDESKRLRKPIEEKVGHNELKKCTREWEDIRKKKDRPPYFMTLKKNASGGKTRFPYKPRRSLCCVARTTRKDASSVKVNKVDGEKQETDK